MALGAAHLNARNHSGGDSVAIGIIIISLYHRLHTPFFSSSSSSSVNEHRPQSWPLLSFLVHAGLFCCLHSPPNSDVDYRIFNVRM